MNGSVGNWFVSVASSTAFFGVASPIFGDGTMRTEAAAALAGVILVLGKAALMMIDKNNEARHQEKNAQITILEKINDEQRQTILDLQERNAEKSAIIDAHFTNHDTIKENE